MNSQNSKVVRTFIKTLLFLFVSFVHVTVRAWEIDFSRRAKDLQSTRGPASLSGTQEVQPFPQNLNPNEFVENFVQDLEPTQEIVILNTDKGFIPETVSLRKGQNYKVHVVNVNEGQKNSSFILDAFAEHHATFYGQHKTFTVSPKLDGVFAYQCPETAKQGRFVVYSGNARVPATNIQPITAQPIKSVRRYTAPSEDLTVEPVLRVSAPIEQENLELPSMNPTKE